jgi:hypothetical protein
MSTNNHIEWQRIIKHTHYAANWLHCHGCAIEKIVQLQAEIHHLKDVLSKYDVEFEDAEDDKER